MEMEKLMGGQLLGLFPAKINDVPLSVVHKQPLHTCLMSGSTVTACRALENVRATAWMTYSWTAGVLTSWACGAAHSQVLIWIPNRLLSWCPWCDCYLHEASYLVKLSPSFSGLVLEHTLVDAWLTEGGWLSFPEMSGDFWGSFISKRLVCFSGRLQHNCDTRIFKLS